MTHKLKPYKSDEDFEGKTITNSNLMRGLLKDFYNHRSGIRKSFTAEEGRFFDQRVFGPAVGRGLIAFDGHVWSITDVGVNYVQANENRSAWKDHASRDFSHYIKAMRMFTGLSRISNGSNGRSKSAAA